MNKSEIALYFRESLQCTEFLIETGCLGTYKVEYIERLRNLKSKNPGHCVFYSKFKNDLRTKLECLKVILT